MTRIWITHGSQPANEATHHNSITRDQGFKSLNHFSSRPMPVSDSSKAAPVLLLRRTHCSAELHSASAPPQPAPPSSLAAVFDIALCNPSRESRRQVLSPLQPRRRPHLRAYRRASSSPDPELLRCTHRGPRLCSSFAVKPTAAPAHLSVQNRRKKR